MVTCCSVSGLSCFGIFVGFLSAFVSLVAGDHGSVKERKGQARWSSLAGAGQVSGPNDAASLQTPRQAALYPLGRLAPERGSRSQHAHASERREGKGLKNDRQTPLILVFFSERLHFIQEFGEKEDSSKVERIASDEVRPFFLDGGRGCQGGD